MNLDLNRILDAGVEVAQSVKVAAVDLADKGKRQVELLNAQNKLARAQRQLGALVYSLIRSGEENRELVDKYVQAMRLTASRPSRSSPPPLPPPKRRSVIAPSAAPRWKRMPSFVIGAGHSSKPALGGALVIRRTRPKRPE